MKILVYCHLAVFQDITLIQALENAQFVSQDVLFVLDPLIQTVLSVQPTTISILSILPAIPLAQIITTKMQMDGFAVNVKLHV